LVTIWIYYTISEIFPTLLHLIRILPLLFYNMGEPPFNRAWMYDRCYSGRRGSKESFVLGVEEFVRVARQSRCFELEGRIRCLCIKCDCIRILTDEVVKVHLYKKGFIPNYWI